jgi:hypothetical protein
MQLDRTFVNEVVVVDGQPVIDQVVVDENGNDLGFTVTVSHTPIPGNQLHTGLAKAEIGRRMRIIAKSLTIET